MLNAMLRTLLVQTRYKLAKMPCKREIKFKLNFPRRYLNRLYIKRLGISIQRYKHKKLTITNFIWALSVLWIIVIKGETAQIGC